MSRAERRRKKREEEREKTVTYTLTQAEIDDLKKTATHDAINTAMTLMLVLPLEVLMDHYWQDCYKERIPEFTDLVLEYYDRYLKDELDIEELKKDLWEYGGVRFEESKERVFQINIYGKVEYSVMNYRRIKADIVFKCEADNDLNKLDKYKELQRLIIDEFLARREAFVDLVNPLYETWNKDFDDMYPGLDGYSNVYWRFLSEKYYPFLKAANALDIFPNILKLRCDCENDETGVIYGFVGGIGLRVYMRVGND